MFSETSTRCLMDLDEKVRERQKKKKKNERKRITIERENNSFIGDRMKHSSGL